MVPARHAAEQSARPKLRPGSKPARPEQQAEATLAAAQVRIQELEQARADRRALIDRAPLALGRAAQQANGGASGLQLIGVEPLTWP
jgi:hypothetical protein